MRMTDPEAAFRSIASLRRRNYAVGVLLLSVGMLTAQTTKQVGASHFPRTHSTTCS